MGVSALASRLTTYYARHGFSATAQRGMVALRRALFANRQVVFYCDLAGYASPYRSLPASLRVERKKRVQELDPEDLKLMIEFWNPRLGRLKIEQRFALGASLWIIKFEETLAGYGWTLRGHTIMPYYFPMAEQDVQFFDFHVFPKFRGRGMDWCLMTQILCMLSAEGGGRAFAEAGEWNRASLSSLQMTPFRYLGLVRFFHFFGRKMICWSRTDAQKALLAVQLKARCGTAQASLGPTDRTLSSSVDRSTPS